MRVCALCTLLPHTSCFQKADKNDSIPESALLSETDCIFYGEKGKEINLTPLEGTDGKPRFVHRTFLLKSIENIKSKSSLPK